MKKIASHYIAVLTGAAILFASCAVLTIDVDVYKGPLANHKDVQVEQMAAMAIGAKPLLVELRDALEAKGPKGNLLRDAADFRKKANEECWYKPEYIAPAPDETRSRFTNQNADRVNEILSLYKDLERDEQYSIYVGRARQALKDYKTAYEILGPESMEADKQLWKKIGPKRDSFKDKAESLPKSQRNANAVTVLSESIETLRSDYEEFYTKEYRDARPLFASWNTIRDQLSISQIKDLEALQNNPLLKDKDEELRANANAQFRALSNTSLVDFHAEYLFGMKGRKKDIFVEHVKKISRAFLDARDALERLWRTEMEAIIWLSDKSQETVFRSDPCIIDTAKASLKVIQPPDPRIIDIAKASLEVIQPRYVAILIEHKDDIKHYMPMETEYLSELLSELTVSGLAVKGYKWDDSSYENAKNILQSAFHSEPANTAKALLASHQFCRLRMEPKDFGEEIHKEAGHLGYISGWKFGLVRAPFSKEDTPDVTPLAMTRSVEGAFPHGAFGKGRLDEGLETLIEKYLRLTEICNPNDEELRLACKRLSDALVRFAEKVLFVANNNSLISPPKEQGLGPGLYDVTVRGIFGERLRDQLSKSLKYTLPDTDTKCYTRVLQAVGNSILVQVDALRQEEAHQLRLKGRMCEEIKILKRTLSDPNLPLADMNSVVDNCECLEDKDRTSKEVRDIWITVLKYGHDLALSKGEPNRAAQLKQAIIAAEEKRAGMVYIHPAMAYLRTSFPATSLQDNPNLTWDNMLGGHMMRSMPFGPQLRDFLDPDAKRDAQINAEIDKQFWQNINRVRVAGGGFTNYAVVKDDIGNWYVKGYSADPCDVIKSARNLAMFSLSAKMNTDFLKRTNRDNGGQPSTDKSDANQTAVERLYNKYKDQYNSRTRTDRGRLIELLKSEMKSAIMQAWQQNDGLNGSISRLENKLDAAIELHLKKPADELEETKDVTEHGSKIISALHAIRRFHNTLLADVHNTITASARDKLLRAEENKATRELELSKAKEIYSDFAIEKDMTEIDWNYKSAAAAEDPDNSVKKQLSDEAKDELDRAKAAFMRAEEEVEEKQAAVEAATNMFETTSIEFDTAVNAEERSIRDVTRIVREKIVALIMSRIDSIKEYETAIMFIGESNKQ